VNGTTQVQNVNERVPNHIPGWQIAETIYPQIAGQGIGLLGVTFELGAEFKHTLDLHKQHLSGHAAAKRVLALKHEIDRLRTQFDRQAAESDNPASYKTESAVFEQIEDRALYHFTELEAQATRNSTGRYIEVGVSIARNTVGAVGNALNCAGLCHEDRNLNGHGSILNVISASILTMRPMISNFGITVAKKYSEHRNHTNFPDLQEPGSVTEFATSIQQLRAASQSSPEGSSIHNRLALYDEQTKQFAEDESIVTQTEQWAKFTPVRRYREMIYGPTKLAQSIMSVQVNLGKEHSATHDNRMGAAGNLTYTCGQAFNILELSRERIVDEANHKKDKAATMLPEQRIERNQVRLKAMKALLPSSMH
jgi:hypothetical protein